MIKSVREVEKILSEASCGLTDLLIKKQMNISKSW
jgi:hypothetical protein